MESPAAEARVGVCAILGPPNVGKSTLLNRMLDLRLAAVSPRPQTTRNRILGVKNTILPDGPEPRAVQMIFVDTPGAQAGRGPLGAYMQEQALSAAADCDLALLVIDVSEAAQKRPSMLTGGPVRALSDALERAGVPVILALNKVDRVKSKDELLPILEAFAAGGRFAEMVPVSALKGDGTDRIEAAIAARLPVGPRLFPDEMYTDRSERFLAGELVREQLFRQLGKEVPYATAVVVEAFEDRRDRGDMVIQAVIHVERDSQRGIVIGKGGQRLKSIGQKARAAISQLFGVPVHLKLYVKISQDWSRGERGIRDMGYE